MPSTFSRNLVGDMPARALGVSSLALLLFSPAAWSTIHVVLIENMTFKSAGLAVKRGDTVTWENRDVVPHTATAKGLFNSGPISPGGRWSWSATSKGSHGYVCTFHPGMAGTVEVK